MTLVYHMTSMETIFFFSSLRMCHRGVRSIEVKETKTVKEKKCIGHLLKKGKD